MLTLEQVCRDYTEQQVRLFAYPVGPSRGACIEIAGNYGVFVDVLRLENSGELTALLAHELGHCATGATHALSSPYDLVARHEAAANRWAFRRYLPFEELQSAAAAGHIEEWQLAEHLGLPQPFIHLALQYYTEACGLRLQNPPNTA